MKLSEMTLEQLLECKAKAEELIENKRQEGIWEEKVFDKIIKEQTELIEKEHGKKYADSANYGWGSSCDGTFYSVATKVYKKGAGVLQSCAKYPSFEISHEWV